jgi:hypothetical protein
MKNSQIEKLNSIGFKELPKKRYLSLMEEEKFDYTIEMSNYYWLIYEGNLKLDSRQIGIFSGISVLILGDLTVEGVFDYQDISSMFVLGDVKAKSILLSSTSCYFGRATYFEEVLIVMGGSGAPVHIENPIGAFLYNDSDAADIIAKKDMVKVFVDYSYDESFGKVRSILKDEFIVVEDEYIEIKITDICDAVVVGKQVLKISQTI